MKLCASTCNTSQTNTFSLVRSQKGARLEQVYRINIENWKLNRVGLSWSQRASEHIRRALEHGDQGVASDKVTLAAEIEVDDQSVDSKSEEEKAKEVREALRRVKSALQSAEAKLDDIPNLPSAQIKREVPLSSFLHMTWFLAGCLHMDNRCSHIASLIR